MYSSNTIVTQAILFISKQNLTSRGLMLETILIRAVTPGFTEVFGFPKTIRMWDESSFKHRSTAGVRR